MFHQQYVAEPTHVAGHTLDLVISASNNVCNVKIGNYISDHRLVTFTLDVHRPANKVVTDIVHNWKKMSLNSFENDLVKSEMIVTLNQ